MLDFFLVLRVFEVVPILSFYDLKRFLLPLLVVHLQLLGSCRLGLIGYYYLLTVNFPFKELTPIVLRFL